MNSEPIQRVQIKQYLYQKAARNRIPITANFELTPICNFNCKMCYIHQSAEQVKNHPRSMMTLEEWIQLAKELKAAGTLYILLTGGEPLLWPDFWKLYEKLTSMGFIVSVNSNGSLINSEVVQRFMKMPPSQINISLYGACDETYENLCGLPGMFERVRQSIDALISAGITVRLNGSITPYQVKDLAAMVTFARERNLCFKTTTYMYPPVRRNASLTGKNDRFSPEEAAFYRLKIAKLQMGEEGYRQYIKRILDEADRAKKEDIGNNVDEGMNADERMNTDTGCSDSEDTSVRCMAGKASIWFTWDGYAAFCGMIPDYRVDLREGRSAARDLSDDDFPETENHDVQDYFNFPEIWQRIQQMGDSLKISCGPISCNPSSCSKNESCSKNGSCSLYNSCSACPAKSYAETGSTDGRPDYICRMTRHLQKLSEEDSNSLEFHID